MKEGQPQLTPQEILEQAIETQTSFSGFMKFLVTDGLKAIEATIDERISDEEKSTIKEMLIAQLTAAVVENRIDAGMSTNPQVMWDDPMLNNYIEEFIVDNEVKKMLGRGMMQGFETTGIIPEGWREFADNYRKDESGGDFDI